MNAILSLEAEIASLRQMLAEKESLLLDLKRKETEKVIATSGLDGSSVAGQAPQCVGDSLPRWAIERYSRQIVLESVGVLGQARVCSGRALVVGAGGLGCPALAYLAGAGVGTLGIVDYDTVDVSNLHRQILHGEDMQGVSKVQSAAQAVKRLNSHVEVKTYDFQLTSANALDIVSQYDVVLDCSDNVATRYLVNDACILANIPLVSGSALKMEGQLAIYGYTPNPDNKGERTACYRCVFPRPPPPETVGACSAQGVLGPAPGLVGVLQALETVKLLAGRAPVTTMLLFDGEECSFRRVKLRGRNPDCAVCSDHPTVTSLVDYEMFCQSRATETDLDLKILPPEYRISPQELSKKLVSHNLKSGIANGVESSQNGAESSQNGAGRHLLVDVRSEEEFKMCRINGSINYPIDKLSERDNLEDLFQKIATCEEVTFVCRRGNDSQLAAAKVLERLSPGALDPDSRGPAEGPPARPPVVADLIGGLHAWSRCVDPNFPIY